MAGFEPGVLIAAGAASYTICLKNCGRYGRRSAPTSLTAAVAALRLLYTVTLGRDWVLSTVIPAPKRPDTLPVVLSPDEVVQFLACVKIPMHRTILTTCHGAGLRISEAIRLTVPAIDSRRMVLRVEQGKGQKDRYVMLSPTLLALLREWWRLRRQDHWLFPSDRPDGRITDDGRCAAGRAFSASLAVGTPRGRWLPADGRAEDGQLGSGLRTFDGDCEARADNPRLGVDSPDYEQRAPCGWNTWVERHRGVGVSMTAVAERLSVMMAAPVSDGTGWQELFTCDLTGSTSDMPSMDAMRRLAFAALGRKAPPQSPSDSPRLLDVLQRELGLKLVGDRATTNDFIVEQVEPLIEN
jgi:hypothetical protein